ncbi:MAG: type I restriction endonuclease [bacterium]
MELILNFIEELKINESKIRSYDESNTDRGIVLKLLNLLGWDTFNPDEVFSQYSAGSGRVDYSLRISGQNKVFLEIKKAGENLEKGDYQEQLLNYSFKQGVKLAVLTNGITWWFYLPLNEGSWEQRKFYSIDIFQQEPEDIIAKFQDFLSKDNIASGKAYDNADSIYKSQQKYKTLSDTIPIAWNKIISEPNELLIELINETTEKICGYKADNEMIKKFILRYNDQLKINESNSIQQRSINITSSIKSVGTNSGKSYKDLPFSHKKIVYFRFKGIKYEVNNWRKLLLKLLEIMNQTHKNDFDKVFELKSYFNKDPRSLTDPKKINNTDIFVETNLSANSIVRLSHKIINLFGYSNNDLVIEYEPK